MNQVTIHFGEPAEARETAQSLQLKHAPDDAEWHDVEMLFNPDRIEWADEAVFLKNEKADIVSLGLICKQCPCIISYYTVLAYRRMGYGYALMKACAERICETSQNAVITIEPTNPIVYHHIENLRAETPHQMLIY